MPGIASSTPDAVVTKDRLTSIEFEPVTQYLLARPAWYHKRQAHEIARGEKAGRKARLNVRLEPSIGAWRLSCSLDEIGRVTETDFSAAAIPPAALNLPADVSSYETFHSPSDLPGVSPGGSVISSGVYAYRRAIPDGDDWDVTLQQSSPAPPADADVTNLIPLLRFASSKATYPANCGFSVTFARYLQPGFVNPSGILWRLYFGGGAERTPENYTGGGFCLEHHGDRLVLQEYMLIDGVFSWQRRLETPTRQGDSLLFSTFTVLPLGRRNILIQTLDGGQALALASQANLAKLKRDGLPTLVYRNQKTLTGCEPTRTITGAGEMVLEVRRTYRGQVNLFRTQYQEEGYVQDLAFTLPWPKIPAGTLLTLRVNAELVPGTDLTAKLYDATDDSEITPTGAGISVDNIQADYSLGADQTQLYVKIELTGDGDQTPLFYGYEVEVAGLREERTPTVVTGGNLQTISISGPDLDPSQAQARATIKDVTAQLGSLLPVRGSIHTRIKTRYNSGGDTTILHEGMLLEARAKKRGRSFRQGMGGASARAYPSADWRDYDLIIGSMWVRIQRQLNLSVEQFSEDAAADPDPKTGTRPPWKITDIIRYCFTKLGWPETQLDIPGLDVRLWPSEGTLADLTLYPAQSFAEFLVRLSRDYLGMILLWDPNAGTANGMWRLIYNPTVDSPSLATFVSGAATGRLQGHPNSYGEFETFIIQDTYDSWVVPPEANFVLVTATGALLPADGGATGLLARIYNKLSFNWDPDNPTADATHPDYLGEMVPLILFDPTLSTPEAVGYVARRLYDRACHAEKWFTFQAPALFVEDESDTHLDGRKRPLRINDRITVLGEEAIVRSANYGWSSDVAQVMTIEGRFLT